jgi:transposase
MTTHFVAYIGIDWADRKHDICLYDPGAQTQEYRVIGAQPQDIADWVHTLQQRYGNAPIAVCLEQKRGPLIYALCQYDNLVLFPINPRTVAHYRRAFQPSRAKSDPVDAQLLIELLLKHGDKILPWQPATAELRALRQWTESRRMLVGEKVRLTNRLTAALKNYYPQVLDWFEDKDTQVFCDFLSRYPDLQLAQTASAEELTQFFKTHHVVRRSAIERRLQQIRTAGIPLTKDAGIVEPMQWLVQALLAQLKVLLVSLEDLNQRIEDLFQSLPDATFFDELPGAGPHLAPRLLVAFGDDRSRFKSAQALMSYIGIAPVKEESGKKRWTHWRWSCPKFLRQTFVEWTDQSRRHSPWANAFYQQQRKAGKSHPKAIRSLAYKWGRILWRCWQNNTPYNEAIYLQALQRKGSPLAALISFPG